MESNEGWRYWTAVDSDSWVQSLALLRHYSAATTHPSHRSATTPDTAAEGDGSLYLVRGRYRRAGWLGVQTAGLTSSGGATAVNSWSQ